MPILDTRNGPLYFAQQPRDAAPELLLIHGAAGTHLDWPMRLRRMRAVAPDLNGHGKSPGDGRETIAEHADDMAALVDALDSPGLFVCGHSMGGAVALELALRHPAAVRGLILIASGAKLRVHPDILAQAERDPAAVADILFRWLWGDAPEAVRERGRAMFMAQKPSVIARDYRACDAFDVRDRLSEVTAPTLVLCGTADVMMPARHSEALAEGIPGAALRLFDGAGHNLHLERPDDVADAIGEWMAKG